MLVVTKQKDTQIEYLLIIQFLAYMLFSQRSLPKPSQLNQPPIRLAMLCCYICFTTLITIWYFLLYLFVVCLPSWNTSRSIQIDIQVQIYQVSWNTYPTTHYAYAQFPSQLLEYLLNICKCHCLIKLDDPVKVTMLGTCVFNKCQQMNYYQCYHHGHPWVFSLGR